MKIKSRIEVVEIEEWIKLHYSYLLVIKKTPTALKDETPCPSTSQSIRSSSTNKQQQNIKFLIPIG